MGVTEVRIERLGPGDEDRALAAWDLFDLLPTRAATERFLASEGNHLLFAAVDGRDVGFVSGVEITHPDKGTELFLYELGVDEAHRRRGIGRALVRALAELAVERGCYGMWVAVDPDNDAALATYRSAGGALPEPAVTVNWDLGSEAPGP